MTRLTAAILLGLTALPAHAATTALHCERLFDSSSGRLLDARTVVVRDGRKVDFVMKDGVVYRSPAP